MWQKADCTFVMSKENGFALPLVLGITTILVVIVISISTSVSRKINLITELDSRTHAEMKTYSAFNEVVFNMSISMFTSTDMVFVPVATPDVTVPMGMESGITLWNLFGVPIPLKDGVTVTMRDAAGMISLFSDPQLMERFLSCYTTNTEQIAKIVDSLADWRDQDDFKHINGAEALDYRMAGYRYGPRNAYLQSVDEFNLVMGMTPELFDRICPEMIYWASGNINYLTMSESLLRAALQDDKMTDQILQLRRNRQLTGSLFSAITGLQETESNIFMPPGFFHLEISAQVEQATDRIQAIVSKKGSRNSPFTITEWVR